MEIDEKIRVDKITKERWTDAKTKSFIKRYIELPSLWNISDPNYAQKANKEAAYKELIADFDLSLTQVRNKIRIYRTTYAQELKKMELNKEYVPKLSWFPSLHSAFHRGKVKSFVKTPKKEIKVESIKPESIEIEFQDASDDGDEAENETHQYEIKKVGKIEQDHDGHHIIIEPYDDEYEDETVQVQNTSNVNHSVPPSSSNGVFGMTSNELFLKSLQSMLDKLPDDKNMRARIKIQEILYQIAYEK